MVKQAISGNKREIRFPDKDELHLIGIVKNQNETRVLHEEYFNNAKEIVFLELSRKEKTEENTQTLQSNIQYNFFGLPRKKSIEFFCEKAFDLLIDCTDGEDNQVLEFILARSLAKFKVTNKTNSKAADLIIKTENKNKLELIKKVLETIDSFGVKTH